MRKANVVAEIVKNTGIDATDVQIVVETFFQVIKNSMVEGNNIHIRGFGSFVNKKKARKIARDLLKNTAIVIDAHYVPSFKPSKIFVEKIKNSKKVILANE